MHDPQQRLLLEVCWRAMEAGAQSLVQLRGRLVGVFMGISSADYTLLWASENQYSRLTTSRSFSLETPVASLPIGFHMPLI